MGNKREKFLYVPVLEQMLPLSQVLSLLSRKVVPSYAITLNYLSSKCNLFIIRLKVWLFWNECGVEE